MRPARSSNPLRPAPCWRLLVVTGAAWAVAWGAVGQEHAEEGGARTKGMVQRWKREAAVYRIVLHTSPETVPELRAESALDWTNPLRVSGGVGLVWVANGRPQVFACFFRYLWDDLMREAHEFHSLATVPLTASLDGQPLWRPRGPGVRPVPIPGAPRPDATPAGRLRQLRALAREFNASVDLEKGGTALRLLPQPLYRYESEADGALFAFVLATDPEALLLVDERPTDAGSAWHYAFARMSNHSLAARRGDRVVWEAPIDPQDTDPAKPYWVRWDIGPRDQAAP